jgi:uncharacterized damage-inducible protein DinB
LESSGWFITIMTRLRLWSTHRPADDRQMDARYPVGKFVLDNDVTPDKRRDWIRQLDALPRDVRNALEALPPGGLDTPYRDGGWTARQVVHHLADSHSNAYTRIKLALTEDSPAIKTYEEQLWAELPDSKADVASSLAILDGIHARLTIVLEALTAEQFARTALHPQWGQMTVDMLLQLYAWHSRHHVAHIGLARSDRAQS